VELTGGQLLAAMENAVSRIPAADGRFPQVAGMALECDPAKSGLQGLASVTTPSRIRSLAVTRADGSTDLLVNNFVAQGDLSRTFVMATNSFLATGSDGYASIAAGKGLAVTQSGEQQILEDYIQDALGGVVNVADPPPMARVQQTVAP
jgi:5'-nucleotidase